MSPGLVLKIGQDVLRVTLLISAPILLVGLVVGVVISIFQAVTQIQEMTLTFVPKMIAIALVLIFLAPWMLRIMVGFTEKLYAQIPFLVR